MPAKKILSEDWQSWPSFCASHFDWNCFCLPGTKDCELTQRLSCTARHVGNASSKRSLFSRLRASHVAALCFACKSIFARCAPFMQHTKRDLACQFRGAARLYATGQGEASSNAVKRSA